MVAGGELYSMAVRDMQSMQITCGGTHEDENSRTKGPAEAAPGPCGNFTFYLARLLYQWNFYFIGRSFPAFLKCKSSVHGKDGKVQYER